MTGLPPSMLRLSVIYLIVLPVGCNQSSRLPPSTPSPSASEPAIVDPFVRWTPGLSPEFTYRNGAESGLSSILESLGGGVGWVDYDRDGWLDLFATGGGSLMTDSITGARSGLFRNNAAQTFRNVTDQCRATAADLYSHGVAIADYDSDGFCDIVVTGYGRPQFWRNMGDGTLTEASQEAGMTDTHWSSSAGWADLNGDGFSDLYITHYVNWSFQNDPYCAQDTRREICSPREFSALADTLYYSRGDGTFEDATKLAGLRQDGKGLGVLLCDIEPDGDTDIFVANDTTENFLYINDGRGKLEEAGLSRGVAVDDKGVPNGSMGVDLCDFNGDGKPDLWVTNYEREAFALYRNERAGHFLHMSQRLGVTDLGGLFVGFGTACEDFDSDGDTDMLVANGHVIKYSLAAPRRQLPLLLQFDKNRFRRASFPASSYFSQPHEGRGLAVADFDQDGDLDVAISHLNEPVILLENQFQNEPRSLTLELIGTRSNRDAIGARIELRCDDRGFARQVIGGGSYLSHSCRAVHFALPNLLPLRELIVHWPTGQTQTFDAQDLHGRYVLIEPQSDGDSTMLQPQPPWEARE